MLPTCNGWSGCEKHAGGTKMSCEGEKNYNYHWTISAGCLIISCRTPQTWGLPKDKSETFFPRFSRNVRRRRVQVPRQARRQQAKPPAVRVVSLFSIPLMISRARHG